MWKAVLLPIALVVAIWVLTSATTTYYLLWLDSSYERVLTKNVRALQAADALQSDVWQVLLDYPESDTGADHFRKSWSAARADIDRQLTNLKDAAIGSDEPTVVNQLDRQLQQLIERVTAGGIASAKTSADSAPRDKRAVRELGGAIANTTRNLLSLNQQMLDNAAARRKDIQGYVFIVRTLLLIGGPALGTWLGWKLSRRLHQSVARLSVTLRDASTRLEQQVGSVELSPGRDLGEVQTQADQVVSRIREVSQELDSARQEVLQAERLAAVGGLAAGVAHELRNPLTSIKLLLQHACRQTGEITLQENKARLLLEETSKMESTIQGLLDFARPPELSRVPHDLTATLKRGLNLIDGRCRQKNIEVNCLVCEDPLLVNGNVEQLHQVFVNLLINAIEAMPQGGTLGILAAPTSDGTSARVEVTDTGSGISASTLSRLFEPFVTTKARGTGLGLAISQRIIAAHGGSIRAANRPSGGAVFTVDIPITSQLQATEESAPVPAVGALA